MASDYIDIPRFLGTREGEAYSSQWSDKDYQDKGDTRPYQIVYPSYPAPKFLQRYAYLDDALRECGTLCQLTGQPFRLVKWGSRLPCYPCGVRKTRNRLPSLKITSPGAIAGYPNAQPIAEFRPHTGAIVFDKNGAPKLVGGANFVVSRTPTPPSNYVDFNTPIPQRYMEAVKTAQYLARTEGRTAFLCSSAGASCQSRDPKKWKAVYYVQPGGLVGRYPRDLPLKGSAKGSTTAVNAVTEQEFRDLLRESEGGSRLGHGH